MKIRILMALAITGMLTVPAAAQGLNFAAPQTKDPQAEAKQKEQERAYNAATSRIPDKQVGGSDPWGNVRGVNEASAKPQQPKPKTR